MKKIAGLFIVVITGFSAQHLAAHEAEDPDSKVRKKVIEGLLLAESAKTIVEDAFHSGGVGALESAAIQWNEEFNYQGTTGHVARMFIASGYDQTPGAIYIEYDTTELPQLTGNNIMILTPSIRNSNASTALSDDISGNIEWACEGYSFIKAQSLGLLMAGGGTVIPRYAPEECQ